jgi:hypothetical protein
MWLDPAEGLLDLGAITRLFELNVFGAELNQRLRRKMLRPYFSLPLAARRLFAGLSFILNPAGRLSTAPVCGSFF